MTIANKPVVTVAALMMVLYLLVAEYDANQFLLLHFFESIIYLIIILLFFYLEDRFGYALGILIPAVWIALNSVAGVMVPAGLRELGRVLTLQSVGNPVGLLAGLILLTGILLIILSWRALRREIVGTPYLRSTLLVGGAITVVYYVIVGFLFVGAY
ncbi:MAG: hypothetical protein ACE5H2_01505 [Terriglobia bacterium]